MLLSKVLFEKIFSSSKVLPELPFSDHSSSILSVPFVKNLSNPTLDSEFAISLTAPRRTVARVLQDFCSTFILLHEIAHVVCGHCPAHFHYFSEPKLQEFYGLELWLFRGRYLRRSWEYDADITAASILSQYIEHFHKTGKHPDIETAFQFLGGRFENLVGLVTAALFTMFAYLSQMEYRLGSKSYHPHPMLRTKYIAQALLRRCATDYALDPDEIYNWQIEYMSQMAQEMDALQLFDWNKFDANFVSTDSHITRLSSVAGRLRSSCEQWAWIPVSVWETLHAAQES